MKIMRLRFILPALLIGAGLMLPVQTPAAAKTYKYKVKKFKGKKFKVSKKYKNHNVVKHKAVKH